MAFPLIVGFGGTNSGGNVTTTTVDIPARAGGPAIGDLIIIGIVKDGTGAFTWPGTPVFTSFTGLPLAFQTQGVLDIRWRISTGNETTVAITHASEGTAHQVYRIARMDNATNPEGGTPSENSSTNPDPPALNPAGWAIEDTMWLAWACNDGNTAITAAPASYTNFQNDRWANANGVGIASARRENATGSEDPGVFTMATEQWAADTIGIRPEAATIQQLAWRAIKPDKIDVLLKIAASGFTPPGKPE